MGLFKHKATTPVPVSISKRVQERVEAMDERTLKMWLDNTLSNIGRLIQEGLLEEARMDASLVHYMLHDLILRKEP